MSTQRYYVVKARVKPRIYVAALEVVKDHFTVGGNSYKASEWTTDANAARTFTLNVAVSVARRNAHCITVLKQ